MDINVQTRYYMEHEALPRTLYQNAPQLMASLMQGVGQAMCNYYAKAEAMNPSYHCPYTADQFSLMYREFINKKDAVLILRIGMPKPEASPLCRAVYLCYGRGLGDYLYFTSELTEDGEYFLCAWSKSGTHLNYGVEDENEYDRVAELYWDYLGRGGGKKRLSK